MPILRLEDPPPLGLSWSVNIPARTVPHPKSVILTSSLPNIVEILLRSLAVAFALLPFGVSGGSKYLLGLVRFAVGVSLGSLRENRSLDLRDFIFHSLYVFHVCGSLLKNIYAGLFFCP